MRSKRLPWLLASILFAGSATMGQNWLQWGGPNRNFMPTVSGLAASWPAAGPPVVWSRQLGEGYSAIIVDGSLAYTMYRLDGQESLIALNAADGKAVWEYKYNAQPVSGMNLEYGPGPHSTPLIVGNLVFAAGAMGHLNAVEKTTGKLVWSHNLRTEFNGFWDRGYSCSPIAYRNSVILTTGAEDGQSVAAFNQADGKLLWKKQSLAFAPSSPILITVDGQEQLVVFMGDGPAGLNPANGDLLWSYPHPTAWGLNISTPVWGPGNLLFLSAAYNGGSRMLQLSQQAGKTTVAE